MNSSLFLIESNASILLSKNMNRYSRFIAAKNISNIARELHENIADDVPERAMQEPTPHRIRYLLDCILDNSSMHRKGDLMELEAATSIVQIMLDKDGKWNSRDDNK